MAPRRTRHEIGPVEPTAAAACQAHAGMVSAIMGGELKTLGQGHRAMSRSRLNSTSTTRRSSQS